MFSRFFAFSFCGQSSSLSSAFPCQIPSPLRLPIRVNPRHPRLSFPRPLLPPLAIGRSTLNVER